MFNQKIYHRRSFMILVLAMTVLAAVIMPGTNVARAATTEQKVYFSSDGSPSCDESGYFIRIGGTTESWTLTGTYSNISGSSCTLNSDSNSCISSITPNGTGKYKIKYSSREGTAEIGYSVTSYYYQGYLVNYVINYRTVYATKTGTKKIRVVNYIDNIYFPSSTATMTIGDTEEMAVETTDDYYSIAVSEAIDGFYTYSSSNTSVATVDSTGKVTAVAAGTATITCTTTNGLTATCTVTVKSPAVTKITLNKTSVTLKIGKTATLSYTTTPADAETTVTYSSSKKSVATVSSSGKITAVAAGTTTITVKTSNGKKATCKVTVKKNPTSITLSKSSVTILLGKTKTLTATIKPSGATSDVTWKSSNTSVATVSSSGKITAKKAGTCTITATSYNGLKAKCKVTVKKVNATKIKLSKSKLTLNKGKSSTVTYTLTPSNSTSTVTWSSSNKKVATVSNSGKITAKGAGTCTITAKTSNGKKATVKVTVKAPITSVSLSASSKTLNKGKTTTLKATISPSDTTSSTKLTWSSSDTSVATVSSKGKVTAKGAGTCTITVKTSNGKKATCKVTVIIPITGISLSSSSAEIYTGETAKLTATISPSNTTQSKTITWTSSNTSVATVNSSGTVTGVAAGTSTITAASSNGKKTTCKVTVTLPGPDSITIKTEESIYSSMKVGNTQSITFCTDPFDAYEYLTWTSSDTSVVEITKSNCVLTAGKTCYITIKCLDEGTAVITGSAPNGVSVSLTINVTWAEAKSISLSLLVSEDDLTVGNTYLISDIVECEIKPSNAKQDVTWSFRNGATLTTSKATIIDNEYLEVTGTGTITLYATAENGVYKSIDIQISE